MAKWENPFRNTQFYVRPAPRKLKVILFALILACAIALATLGMVRLRIQQQTQAALDQAAALEQENADLNTGGRQESSIIKEIAREELGLVDPDTILIDPN